MLIMFRIWRGVINKIEHLGLNTKLIYLLFNQYNNAVSTYLKRIFSDLIKKYVQEDVEKNTVPMTATENIWIMWWQGNEKAPLLIKKCIESIQKHAKENNVIIISEENYQNYVRIPDWFMEKVESGIIPFVKLSDVIRCALIANYGGVWMDATIFATRDFGNLLDGKDYYTAHNSKSSNVIDVSRNQWTGFLIGGHKGDPVFKFARDFHLAYFRKYNRVIDYLLLDYILHIADDARIGNFHESLQVMPYTQTDLYMLVNELSQPVSTETTKKINASDTFLFKLSWKQEYLESVNNVPTYWQMMKNDKNIL